MPSSFQLVLENKKTGSYQKITRFLVLLNIAVFAIIGFNSNNQYTSWISLAASLIIGLSFIGQLIFKKNMEESSRYAGLLDLIVVSCCWALLGVWLAMTVCILIIILSLIATRPLLVHVSANEINYPSFPAKKIMWSELSNTVLKDDLLTIDFKNNKIIQQMVGHAAPGVNEKEFNDFCRTQLRNAQQLTQ